MKTLYQDRTIGRKASSQDKNFNQIRSYTAFVSGYKLTYVSCLVVVTFIVCMIHEFTFILNRTGFIRKSSSLEVITRGNNTIHTNFVNETSYPQDDSYKLKPFGLGTQLSHIDGWMDDWYKATEEIYIYSAFWDNRVQDDSFVRVIGAALFTHGYPDFTKCLVKYSNSSAILELPSSYALLNEHHERRSKAIFIQCNSSSLNTQPDYVSLVPMAWNDTWPPPSWLPVHDITFEATTSKIGLCVRPMYDFIDAFRVAEFVAYYEALGVSHFTFYVYKVPDKITDFLQELKKSKYEIDVLPWSLPKRLITMWEYGQMASINDCVYRQMKQISYTLVVDLDEYITPREVMTLQEALRELDVPQKNYASFILRSSLFCAEYAQDVLPPVIPPFLTQSSILRNDFIFKYYVRSKYIAKPTLVEVAGIHNVWSHFPLGKEAALVPASQVLVHHYRSSLCLGKNDTLEKGVLDVESRKYLNQLLRSRATAVWRRMFHA